ncbi:DUF1295 domain-containing protein [Agromyces protaetiae]|uniref:DUF1295 domain-containing protein n=1 Tax=Agromyces protaetiae TaxID=2509455 RepID=A0A4P6FE59_9MICO|nr:DUF1295 domain-containing protein [Agromyces protaetiae]QAY74195.1 DUF1295 domain-containing protein [Agromyces protaetiae]
MNPLVACLILCAVIAAATWITSVVTNEHSWVDRIWSIAPVAYAWILAAGGGLEPRLVLMAALVTLWGIRLTFNFARKGGYRPGAGEDYRWAVLRGRMPRPAFEVFNLLFIAGFQNALILAFCLPLWTASEGSRPLGGWDILLAAVFVAFLAGETIADQQQWEFHRWKAAERAAGRVPEPGFVQTGLWRFSRHPNFFFEQAQWWVFYGFAVTATGVWLHWTLVGAVALSGLFIGSTIFTESLTRAKYADYDAYRKRTSMLVPWFAKRREPSPEPV